MMMKFCEHGVDGVALLPWHPLLQGPYSACVTEGQGEPRGLGAVGAVPDNSDRWRGFSLGFWV
jgi:hypothetical protein